jgi:thiosulfate/3-mercaptopyruvate sulfurtransferase
MKPKILSPLFLMILVLTSLTGGCISPGGNDPWTQQQLLSPADLAKTLNTPNLPQPLVFSVGMQAIVKGSIDIGPTMVPENMYKLKQQLDRLPKNTSIVIYCGCCPFSRCPNIRPAMQLLGEMNFTNYKLLNLPENIKVDWIDHGYPMSE